DALYARGAPGARGRPRVRDDRRRRDGVRHAVGSDRARRSSRARRRAVRRENSRRAARAHRACPARSQSRGRRARRENRRGLLSLRRRQAAEAALFPRPDPDLQDRLMLPLVNEAVACWDEGVVEDPDLLDAGVVFGTGFAPFTGGPIRYAVERGVSEVVARLEALARQYGDRFTPRAGWRRIGA